MEIKFILDLNEGNTKEEPDTEDLESITGVLLKCGYKFNKMSVEIVENTVDDDEQTEIAIDRLERMKQGCTKIDYPLLEYYALDYAVDCMKQLTEIKQILLKYNDTLNKFYNGQPRDLLESDVLRDITKVVRRQ